MKTKSGQRGQIVLPKAIRTSLRIGLGAEFEVMADEEDADLILLRRIRSYANAGLVRHLMNCPYKGPIALPKRRAEHKRKRRR